jgi:hypothetical protein
MTMKKRFATISHDSEEPATLAQVNLLYELLSRRKMDIRQRNGLSKRQASKLISRLTGKSNADIS